VDSVKNVKSYLLSVLWNLKLYGFKPAQGVKTHEITGESTFCDRRVGLIVSQPALHLLLNAFHGLANEVSWIFIGQGCGYFFDSRLRS